MTDAVTQAALAVAGVLAAYPALRAYQAALAQLVVTAASVGPAAISFGTARVRRWPAAASYLSSAVGLALLLLAAAGPHPAAVVSQVVHGPNRVLTETLPLAGGREALAPLVVLEWVVVAASGEILMRAGRRRWGGAGLLGLPVLYLACYAAASGAPGSDRVEGPLLLVVLAGVAAIRYQGSSAAVAVTGPEAPVTGLEPRWETPEPGGGRRTRRQPFLAVGMSAALATALALLAPAVPALASRASSVHRVNPTDVPVLTDPVDSMADLRDGNPRQPARPELTVSLSKSSTGYLAVAELERYDGARWTFGTTFHPTGGRVPGVSPDGGLSTSLVLQRVAVTGALPVSLLPALDRPVSVAGLAVVADPTTGMILPQRAVSHPLYTVVSNGPSTTLAAVPPADEVDALRGGGADVQLPPNTAADIATTLRYMASVTAERPAPTVAFLQSALRSLQSTDKRIKPSVGTQSGGTQSGSPANATTQAVSGPGGTSLSEVINAVTVNRAATPEQFATFYAMMARYLGVPARVVTGFRVSPSRPGGVVPAGNYRVTSEEAWAWVEIPVAGMGWVVCDPSPALTTTALAPPPVSAGSTTTTLPPSQANAVPRSQIVGGHALAPRTHVAVHRRHHIATWLVAVVAVAVGLVVLSIAGPGQAAWRRLLRRRRRKSSDPSELAVGAWLELLDGLDRSGVRVASGATNAEVAAEVGNHFSAELVGPAHEVATAAERAVYSNSRLDPAEARLAWDAQVALRRALSSQLDLRQRLRALVLVGSAPTRPSAERRG